MLHFRRRLGILEFSSLFGQAHCISFFVTNNVIDARARRFTANNTTESDSAGHGIVNIWEF